MASTALRRKPLLLCCSKENWTPRFLQHPPAEGESSLDLLVRELELLRAEGRSDLAERLVKAAAKQGVADPRLSSGSARSGQTLDAVAAADLLKDLLQVCSKAGCSGEALSAAEGQDGAALQRACIREMQNLRQQGHQRTVVALGRRALRAGLDHPRLRNNLIRSERLLWRDTLMDKVDGLLAGKRSAKDKAEQLMLEAITEDPDFRSCRVRLEQRLKERLDRGKTDPFRKELLDLRVSMELSRRRLELLEQRCGDGTDPALQQEDASA